MTTPNTAAQPAAAPKPEKTYGTYLMWLWLCGLFGAHHYYTGNNSRGLLYTFTGGGCVYLWIKDLINPRRDFNREMASQGILSARSRS